MVCPSSRWPRTSTSLRSPRSSTPSSSAAGRTPCAGPSGLSRKTVYQRLRTIERLLDCDLESGERRTGLHVALTALDVLRDSGEAT
ncbi:helix-turn-helix domain-containing protein [Streptomyces sp. NPDC087844]|uniref:helix-turn-helix domain-containing protein n=1 Tax=Streptomyces sp. NPDC087844 TaxID=3365805 RepID=UPI003809241A